MNRPFLLDDTLQAQLTALARRKQQTEDQLLQEAVRDYLAREDGRAGFLAEAEQSWQDYQADGLHLTGEEARAWLRSWGTPDEKALPECHD
ncbi:CopG family transcriptional regulator [Rhizobium sp. AG855]|uniref:CopG family ribbon-helix-helix protein n=1 Tax=Rhizobium sp. AG855 TaxID=2183898 RepID=UPI000E729DF8|nr:CopG family transcriptional regulator [Rhizobium sp. AG855]RKE85642.1 putative transcriptional regulator [Rhizobium sp. AG855]